MTIAVEHDLVRQVLEGAAANGRPDLAQRLRAASTAEVPAAIVRALESLEVDLRSRRAALVEPGRGARLDAEARHAEQRRRGFDERAATWRRQLGEALSVVESDFDYALQSGVRSLVEDGTARVRAGDDLATWLPDRLARDAGALQHMVCTATGAVAGHLADSLDVAVPPASAPIVLQPPAVTEQPPGRADRPPAATRLLGVLMPTYSGMMIAVMLPRFFDLKMPLWLIVTVAVAGALAMGGAALAGELQRQTGRRQAESTGDLRSTADAFRMTISKQGRDAVRAIEQQLTATVGEAVRQRTRRLAAEAAVARDRAAEGRDPQAALHAIDLDLESVRELRSRAAQLMQ